MTTKRERLGEITVPSGVLTLLDPGHIGMYEEKEIPEVPSVSIAGMPRERALSVLGVRVGEGEFAERWDHVVIALRTAEITESTEVGDAIVDFARLLLVDEGSADRWVHSECIDGKADFVFWGRDAAAMASELGAPALEEGLFGWRDVDATEALRHGTAAEALKDQQGYLLATDFRPHSHHYQALERARASATQSACIDVGRARVCLFFTSWGDGLFPVFLDSGADGALVQVRIQLRTEASEEDATASASG
jgi:hypothetical protein